jgi:hypothetical protein
VIEDLLEIENPSSRHPIVRGPSPSAGSIDHSTRTSW